MSLHQTLKSYPYRVDVDVLCMDLKPFISEVEEMKTTPQDPIYHSEGKLLTHVRKVFDAFYNSKPNLSTERRRLLFLALFLHDLGKVWKTEGYRENIDGNRIVRYRSPGHAMAGRDCVGKALWGELPPEMWWELCQLIGYHHKPKSVVEYDSQRDRYCQARWLARMVDPQLMYHLESADVEGRESKTNTSSREMVPTFFRELCRESGVWSDRYYYESWDEKIDDELHEMDLSSEDLSPDQKRFIKAESRFAADTGKVSSFAGAVSLSHSYRERFPHLILTVGPSGSGKTRWVKENYSSSPVVSLDEIRAEKGSDARDHSQEGEVMHTARDRLREHLAANETVVWDATNLQVSDRRRIIQTGYDYGAFVTTVLFMSTKDELKARNNRKDHPVPESVLDSQHQRWTLPRPDDTHELRVLNHDHEEELTFLGGCLKSD